MRILASIYLSIGLIFISCSKYESPFEKTTITTIMGTIADIERNIPIDNHPVYVVRDYSCGTWFTAGRCSEVIDSAFTDSQGNYSLTFPMITLGSGYAITNPPLKNCGDFYFREVIDPQTLVPGQTNIRNYDMWCPVVLKLNVQVSNNENPPLLIYSYPDDPGYNFPDVELHQVQTDTTIFLYTKPNVLTNLSFQYKVEDPNANYHFTDEWFDVGIQDTLELMRTVDCSSF